MQQTQWPIPTYALEGSLTLPGCVDAACMVPYSSISIEYQLNNHVQHCQCQVMHHFQQFEACKMHLHL
jgi:hypothetical protein